MKGFLLFFFLLPASFECIATDYYSTGTACPNELSNWNTSSQGVGSSPASFSNNGDRFIIQAGHIMTTNATWAIGGPGSTLIIQPGATLHGDHLILFTGIFQIDNGGTYIHNNMATVDETAGSSIFGGTESFAPDSHFEIRLWPGKDVGLPNASGGIVWGDLIVNLQSDISPDGNPWNWNLSDGAILTIKGNLDIRATYVSLNASTVLCFSSSGVQTINVDGDFLLSGTRTKVSIRDIYSDGYTIMQVNGNVLFKDISQFNLGANTSYSDPYGLYELRFKGNFAAIDFSLIIYDGKSPAYFVANGTNAQTFSCRWHFNRNLKIAPGATVNLTSPLNAWNDSAVLAILGTFNQNGNSILTYGKIEVAGGVFNASGNLFLGTDCIACSNLNAMYNNSEESWCEVQGQKGRINFTNSTISLDNYTKDNKLTAGSPTSNSPGDIYFINTTASAISNEPSFISIYSVFENSILSIDQNSYIGGDWTTYEGHGGTLRIGSADGLTSDTNMTQGNIRTGKGKYYDLSGINNFEYFGTTPQSAGNGLPSIINGTLKINSTAGISTTGITLTKPILVKGHLYLNSGKLTTSLNNLITLDSNASVNLSIWGSSYVSGPIKKIGSESFSFPVGKGNNFAPIALAGTGLMTDEYIVEYFMADPTEVIGSSFDNPPVHNINQYEWWTVNRNAGATAKSVTLEATSYTNAVLLSDLRVMRWDGSAWKNEGNTAYSGVSSGPVTGNLVNSFLAPGTPTPFTFGTVSLGTDPLSLNLLSFDAVKLTNKKASLKWELSTYCSLVVKFEIQKAGRSRNFSTVDILNGNPSSRSYNYIDNNLENDITHYRLKMIDENGKISYSKISTITNGINGLWLTSLAPLVTNNNTTLTITSSERLKIELIITDMQGRLMHRSDHIITAGNTNIQVSVDRLAAGVYQVHAITAMGKTNAMSFIKQ